MRHRPALRREHAALRARPARRPGADPRDGLLDVVTIDGGRRALLGLAPRLRRGTHLGRPGVTHTRAGTIKIATGGRSPVIADTTNVGDTVQLSIAPHALDIVGAAA